MASPAKRLKIENEILVPKSPIRKLSDDVLLEIFEYLNKGTLKEASLVCEKWRKIIGTSNATMKNLQLRYKRTNEAEVLNSTRKWKSVKANLLHCDQKMFFQFVEKFGANLEELIVERACLDASLKELLKNLPSLKSLELLSIKIENSFSETKEPIELSQLTKLVFEFVTNGNRFLEIWSAPRLETLKIIGNSARTNDLTNLLKSVPYLKTLTCTAYSIIGSFKANKKVFPFMLKSFRCQSLKNSQEGPLCEFLLSQSASLEEVDVPFRSREGYEFLFTNMEKLRICHIKLSALPTDSEFYLQLEPNEIKEIYDIGSFSNVTSTRSILGKCPDLEVLNIPEDQFFPHMLPFLSLSNPKLTSLKLYRLETADARFPALNTLDLREFDRSLLVTFLGWNPTIKNLTLHFGGFNTNRAEDDDVSFFTKYGIKFLTLKTYGDREWKKQVYVAIKADPGSIETLKLEFPGDNPLIFTFPVDQSKWTTKQILFDQSAQPN